MEALPLLDVGGYGRLEEDAVHPGVIG